MQTKETEESYKSLINRRKEAANRLRKKFKIKIEGDDVAELCTSFESMAKKYNFGPNFFRALKSLGYTKPTPVQMQGIPVLMQRRNAIILAETGSGKSLAFIVPLL